MRPYHHIFIVVAAAIITLGCERFDEPTYSSGSSDDGAISYSTQVESTRATETKIGDLEGDENGFNIATFCADGGSNAHYFTDTVIYSDDGGWSSGVTRYWPSCELYMFAYYPYSNYVVVNDETTYSDYSLTYSCPVNIYDQVDLLVKTLEGQDADDANGAVVLKFDHALSAIKFNVSFDGEPNVTLESIDINYIGIERERTYKFTSKSWGDSEEKYFTTTTGASTSIAVGTTVKNEDGSDAEFDEIDELLMIIPQPISNEQSAPHYISVRINYTLIGEQDGSTTPVVTGYMPLPAPNTSSAYLMSEIYTYNISVNDEIIVFGDISIDDQDTPVAAYGNIDLGLITEPITYSAYQTAISPSAISAASTTEEESHYYYSTAVRAYQLLEDGVRDFVVVGSFGVTDDSDEHAGKLGYHGGDSSPFFIAASSLGMMPSYNTDEAGNLEFNSAIDPANLFSIDLRGVYDFPTFGSTHSDYVADSNQVLDSEAPILTEGTFKDVALLDEIVLPSGLLAIGDYAFQNCISLTSVDLAEVIHIEAGAFVDCTGLVEVLNGAITRVHEYGFDDCLKLETIDLSNLLEVNESGFVDCASLGEVDLQKLTQADAYAFCRCESMTLSDPDMTSLTSIGASAFQDCKSIGEVKFGATTLASIGDHAFSGCESLYFSGDQELLTNITTIGAYAFQWCHTLGAVPFTTSITEVGDGAFVDCSNVTLNSSDLKSLTSIGAYAFQGCSSVEEVDFSTELTYVGPYAFHGCSSLEFTDNDDLSALTRIEKYSFKECSSLNNTDLNLDLVELVDSCAFQYCSSLEGVSLDAAETINPYAFQGCTALTTVDALAVTTTGDYAFMGCSSLVSVNLPLLTSAGKDFLYGCSSVETLSLPILAIDIPDWDVFSGQKKLKTVDLSSATSVGAGAFADCTALESINLSSATSVGIYAFSGCSSLTELSLPGLVDGGWGDNFISGCYALETLKLNNISNFTCASSDDPITYLLVDWGASNRNSTLQYVDLPNVEVVPGYTFYTFVGLKSVNLSSATSVGAGAFADCTALERLNLSNLVEYEDTGYWAFSGITDDQCELWLSGTLYNTVESGSTTWMGVTWRAIYNADDPNSADFKEFEL